MVWKPPHSPQTLGCAHNCSHQTYGTLEQKASQSRPAISASRTESRGNLQTEAEGERAHRRPLSTWRSAGREFPTSPGLRDSCATSKREPRALPGDLHVCGERVGEENEGWWGANAKSARAAGLVTDERAAWAEVGRRRHRIPRQKKEEGLGGVFYSGMAWTGLIGREGKETEQNGTDAANGFIWTCSGERISRARARGAGGRVDGASVLIG